MGILTGKKIVICGVANEKSIAWGITKAMKAEGAQICLSYVNDALKKRVEPLAEEVGADFIFELDVTNDDHFESSKKIIEEKWGKIDCLVHSLAFADRNDLKGRFHETSRAGFALAHDISAYSLIGLCGAYKELMNKDCSVIAMTYHGSVKVIKNYNVMGVAKAALESSARYLADDLGPDGIRVNCVSAGPIKTLAASGIAGFRGMLTEFEEKAPLRANVTQEDVGKTSVYLASNLSSGVTGQIVYVDSGFSILGL